MKFVVVTGGTISSIGKGTAVSSLGVLLKGFGYPVTAIKIDPYLNLDAGTMSPYEHGEVFVLDDGGECDLDLGNYERFLDVSLTKDHSITTGKIYSSVLAKERKGVYLGQTVQMIPHLTNEIQDWILRVALEDDFRKDVPDKDLIVLIELGGTVGDIESELYLKALQRLQKKVGPTNFCTIHVGFVPLVNNHEPKTKPCQQSVECLRGNGLQADFLFCRSPHQLDSETQEKLSTFCQLSFDEVISLHEVKNTYLVPFLLADQNVGELLLGKLQLDYDASRFRWINMCEKERLPLWRKHVGRAADLLPTFPSSLAGVLDNCYRRGTAKIVIVGKYVEHVDSYLSVVKALQHAALHLESQLFIDYLDSSMLESSDPDNVEVALSMLREATGVLVPGGFGDRGMEGKVDCALFCMKQKTPYLGICLGMQTAVIAVARQRLQWEDANSVEFNPGTLHPVVIAMSGDDVNKGGTMRLGSQRCVLQEDTMAYRIYEQRADIFERHRHRYEINPEFVSLLEKKGGVVFSGKDESGQRMEIMELPDLPFFVATQFHPEFLSRVVRPHPLFVHFLAATTK